MRDLQNFQDPISIGINPERSHYWRSPRRASVYAAWRGFAGPTTYATDYGGKTLSVEIQLVALLNVLATHRCGLLVVEEAQAENLATAKFGREFVLFFLRVLNFGIPMLLIGNPRAFEEVDKNSQDLSRLSDAGSFALDPVTHHLSPMWRRDIMPHLWGWTLGIEDAPIERINQIVWEYTGGFPAGKPAPAIGPDTKGDKPKAAPRVPRKRAVKPVELSNDDLRSPASVQRLGDKLQTGTAL